MVKKSPRCPWCRGDLAAPERVHTLEELIFTDALEFDLPLSPEENAGVLSKDLHADMHGDLILDPTTDSAITAMLASFWGDRSE
jgi:hypothetical protein